MGEKAKDEKGIRIMLMMKEMRERKRDGDDPLNVMNSPGIAFAQ